MLNELLLIKKIKEGDIKAFESLFKSYYTPLCLYTVNITGRQDVSEEIVQDIFYIFWKERERLTLLHSAKSYLYGAVKNRSLQYCEHIEVRRRHREAVLSGKVKPEPTATPQEELEYYELEKLIDHTLQQLPGRRMQIFRMHREDGLKYAEIASAMNLSVKTVEAEMTKALQTLRKEVEVYTRTKRTQKESTQLKQKQPGIRSIRVYRTKAW